MVASRNSRLVFAVSKGTNPEKRKDRSPFWPVPVQGYIMPSMIDPNRVHNDIRQKRAGVTYGLAAFLSWGVLPVYFKAVASVPSLEVLAHRVVWSLVFLLMLTLARGRWSTFTALFRSRRTQLTLMTTTVLIAINWGVFIWAVANGKLVEASLGYFITPLINVVLGFVFLRERLRPLQLGAVVLATCGIVWMTANLGHPPVVSMVLAVSFGFYGLLRKQVPASGIQGLTAETLMLSPVAVAWLWWRQKQGELVFLHGSVRMDLLLMSAGVITALPLIWFAEGARRLRLATMGFLQYLAPTGQLLLAVVFFGEPFTRDHTVSFGLIWVALALYTFDTARGMRETETNHQ
jgi:chloramphenicol-sensitive protein RarD